MMAKISSILPTNQRIATVDMAEAKPVRAGVPRFGRPLAESANKDPLSKTTLDSVRGMSDSLYGPNGKLQSEKRDTKIVQDMADKFFTQKAFNNSSQVDSVGGNKSPGDEKGRIIVVNV